MIVMGVCLFSTLNRCALNCWLLLLISQFHNHINQVGVSFCVGYVSQHLAKLKEGRDEFVQMTWTPPDVSLAAEKR